MLETQLVQNSTSTYICKSCSFCHR